MDSKIVLLLLDLGQVDLNPISPVAPSEKAVLRKNLYEDNYNKKASLLDLNLDDNAEY